MDNSQMIGRRGFLAGLLATGVAVGATSLAGCGQPANAAKKDPTVDVGRDWKTPPEPIDESSATETVEAEIVVVGAGISGVPAALTAIEGGAKTVLLEKGETFFAAPNWFAGLGTSYQKERGLEFDRNEIVNDLMWYANHRADQRLINLWADKSGEAIDWFCGECTEDGSLEIAVETDTKDTDGKHMSPAISHMPVEAPYKEMAPNKMGSRLSQPILVKKLETLGCDIRYKTPAVQLQVSDGRCAGVFAKDVEGNVVLFKASKGVILATGGYSNNRYLLEQLNPNQSINKTEDPEDNGGDGFKMGVWAGGDYGRNAWVMSSDRSIEGGGWTPGSQPWLRVNCFGERFCNEDAPYDFGANAGAMNPGNDWWNVFDSNYWDAMTTYHTTICSRMVPVPGAAVTTLVTTSGDEFYEKYMAPQLENGNMVQADTVEDLAKQMQGKSPELTGEALEATLARYNDLCEKGIDEDFGKKSSRMVGVAKPPYYAMHMITGATGLASLDGLRVNTNLEVIDEKGHAIEGLYAVGNDQGGFYGMSYPWYYAGLHAGKNVTFARIAALHALSK